MEHKRIRKLKIYNINRQSIKRGESMIICPKCGSVLVAPVMYGYPTCEAFELAEQGKLVLGGYKRV